MTNYDKSLVTTLSSYYREKNEKMPMELKLLLFNYNIETIPYNEFVRDIKLYSSGEGDNSGETGNIDGDEEKKEVVKFLLDPDNSYFLGKIGHESKEIELHPVRIDHIVSSYGHVIDEGNARLLLK